MHLDHGLARARFIPGPLTSTSTFSSDRFLEISEANSPQAIVETVQRVAAHFDFPSVQVALTVPEAKPIPFVLKARSSHILEFDRAIEVGSDLSSPYEEGAGDPCLDPVMLRIRASPLPVAWSEATYIDAGLGGVRDWLVEHERQHGVSLCVPVSLAANVRHAHVFVALQRRQPISQREQSRLAADVLLLGVHAAVAASNVLVPRLMSIRKVLSPLTPAMREYLLWAERGKTALETAEIVGRKYSTIKNVLAEAIERTGCCNKAQAVQLSRANGWL